MIARFNYPPLAHEGDHSMTIHCPSCGLVGDTDPCEQCGWSGRDDDLTPTDEAIASALSSTSCGMAITRRGELDACDKPTAGLLVARWEGDVAVTAACAWHLNAAGQHAAVPLRRIVDVAARTSRG